MHLLEDLRANSWNPRPCFMVLAYRVAHFCSVWRKRSVINNLWAAPVLILYRLVTECLMGYEIQAAATIGRRFTVHHGYGVVISKFAIIGDDFAIRHGVTIGGRGGIGGLDKSQARPVIGNGVEVGANVMIIGPITIGNNVVIAAGSLVLDSIPDNAVVMGDKARVKRIL
ncbi:colanic acid biosynthesis acetyltransferase WcaB [Dryocola sp. LX212]